MATRKPKPTDPDTPSEPKGPRLISIDLPAEIAADCAMLAAGTSLSETKIRELVRGVALEAATKAAIDPRSIVRAFFANILG